MTKFTLAGSPDATTVPPAVIDARQFAAFTKFARENSTDVAVVLWPVEPFPTYDMDARVCPWSLSTLCAIFAYDEAVIAVIEEAQFLRRRVRFSKIETTNEITIAVSETLDNAVSFRLGDNAARELLKELKLDESDGPASLTEVRERLADPAVFQRLATTSMHCQLRQLNTLASMLESEDDATHLVWV